MVELKKESIPKFLIPVFTIWIVICNIGAIATAVVFYFMGIEFEAIIPILDFSPVVDLIIIISINFVSLLLLIPLFIGDTVFRFFIPALIWFILVAVVYILFGMYWILIFGGIQMMGDLWYESKYREALKKQNLIEK